MSRLEGSDPLTTEIAPPVFTIGYGARTVDGLIAVLLTHQIVFLVDVRTAPYSRFKPEFSKDALERELKQQGIRYIYLGDALGGQRTPTATWTTKWTTSGSRVKPFIRSVSSGYRPPGSGACASY